MPNLDDIIAGATVLHDPALPCHRPQHARVPAPRKVRCPECSELHHPDRLADHEWDAHGVPLPSATPWWLWALALGGGTAAALAAILVPPL